MTTSRKHLVVTLALAGLLLPSVAMGQSRDSRSLTDTVDRLERQLQTLERTVYRDAPPPAGGTATGGSVPPAALSNLQITTSSLEEQMRRLTGQIEQLDFQVRQLNDRMDRLVADVDFRLRGLEDGNGPSNASRGGGQPVAPTVPQAPGEVTVQAPGSGASGVIGTLTESQLRAAGIKSSSPAETVETANVPAEAAPAPVTLPDGSPQDQYSYARQFLLRRDFVNAEQALAAFVIAHPEDGLAGNAQYWLGETFYVRGDFQTAARTFAEGFQRYPDSSKAPDNLLKLGMSLAQLDQQADACITLKKLRVEYPQAPTSIVQRADREIGRLQCN
ncbi:MAG: tol-pal system protein YbgF [Alphaproteobacteria bacterium]|jgi:tol-pal system protein YbgF